MRTNRIHAMLAVLALFSAPAALLAGPLPFDPADPPQGIFSDEWFVVEFAGGKAGSAHLTMERDGEHITTGMEMHFAIRRGPTRVELEMEQRTRERLDGTPVGFESVMTMGKVPLKTRGKIKGNEIKIQEEQLGKKDTRTYPFDPQAKLSWGLLLETAKQRWEPGAKFTVKAYEASMLPNGSIPARIEVIGPDEIEIDGKEVKATLVRQTLLLGEAFEAVKSREENGADQPGGMMAAVAGLTELPTDTWIDDQGNALRIDTIMGGITLRMTRSTKEVATAGGEPPELFLNMLVNVKEAFDPEADRIVYRLRVTGQQELPDFPQTDMQTFKRIDARTGLLTVRRSDWKALRRLGADRETKGMEKFLRATVSANSEHPKIRDLTREAIEGAKGPAEQADRLRKFVTEYVREKNFNVGFATASEVAESREGDCSEHGLLLAAMARAAGLPSRVVAGIVQVPGSRRPAQFGYHMWTQVHFGGKWVDIDAALRQTECDATHMVVSVWDLNEGTFAEGALALIPLLGQLEIRVETD